MRKLLAPASLALAAMVVLAACSKSKTNAPPPASSSSNPAGVVMADLDTHISPCQDFYQYACGNWMAHNPIPADQASWGTFSTLANHNRDVLHTILDKASANLAADTTPITREVGTFYSACMNTSQINAGGSQPLAAELKAIDGMTSISQLPAVLAGLQDAGVNAVFSYGATQDAKHATANEIAEVDQGGLGLPNRGYYLRQDAKSRALRQEYAAHVAAMFVLLGDTQATADAEAAIVLRIETSLAQASLTPVQRRNPDAIYHKESVSYLQSLTPAFHWQPFFAASGAPAFTSVNIAVPGFFRALNRDLRNVPLRDWETYLRWQLVHAAATSLSQPFVDAHFDFYSKTLEGVAAQQPRWKRCVNSTDRHLGDALGQLYVQAAFSPEAKAHMAAMVENLESTYGKDIEAIDWMTPATKQYALVKLHAIVNKVGYPNKWLDYSSIHLTPDDYYADLENTVLFQSHRQLNKIGKPVDRSEWLMTPPTVNAYYTPLRNQIVFPAGILQPPFYSATRNDAVNYGAVGAVMGHEMTHGFDDEGRKFDAQGNLREWWTPADAKAFSERTACLVQEYSQFSPLPGVHLNGKLTLGENTADNGGVRIAYMAMESALAGKPDPMTDGLTRAQRFFLGYAQIWCENTRPQTARMMANIDPHSPGRFRVDGVVTNMPQFAAAFHCGPSDPMTAGPKACRVW
ncbi:MAG: M13 family metallopeptidase [Terriglobales bacterium]